MQYPLTTQTIAVGTRYLQPTGALSILCQFSLSLLFFLYPDLTSYTIISIILSLPAQMLVNTGSVVQVVKCSTVKQWGAGLN